jgi:hypothetical protein
VSDFISTHYYRSTPVRHVCGTCTPEREFASADGARRHVRKYHRTPSRRILDLDDPASVERLARAIGSVDPGEAYYSPDGYAASIIAALVAEAAK